MNYKLFFKYLFHLYRYSFFKLHFFAVSFVLFSYIVLEVVLKIFHFNYISFIVNLNDNLANVLAGMSILMAFFIFIIQGINYSKINNMFNSEIDFKSKGVTESLKENKIIKNTIFSFVLTPILLLIPLVLLLLFRSLGGLVIDFILIVLIYLIIVYILIGILFSMIFWSYTITKD